MAALLRVLLGRYQFADPEAWNDPPNGPLVTILDRLAFYADPPSPTVGAGAAGLGGGTSGIGQHARRGAA